jgi:hypothetical protein
VITTIMYVNDFHILFHLRPWLKEKGSISLPSPPFIIPRQRQFSPARNKKTRY